MRPIKFQVIEIFPICIFLLLLGCNQSGNPFSWTGSFNENPDGTFSVDTDGDGVPDGIAIDTDGDGEPDMLDGVPYIPPVSGDGGNDDDRSTPVDDNPIPDEGVDLGGSGHHFDVDSFRNTGGDWLIDEVCHVHEFDNRAPHYNVVDFLSDCKVNKKSFGFLEAIDGCSGTILYRLENADRGSGKLELYVAGNEHQLFTEVSFADSQGAVDADWVSHAGSETITKFKLQPNNLDILVGTQPGVVQDDATDRHASFTIKVYCDGNQVWEFATYEHVDH